MRQVLCPVLVGRSGELRALLDALDGAAAGRGTTAVVVGEAGAGKSRLVRELSGVARARGLPVLVGRAAAGAVPVPFRPLAEAVLGELRHHGLPDPPELRPFRPALGRLVPEWRPREPLDVAESLVVLGEGVLRLLRALAGGRGCLLVLEDLHWADPETLAVLEYLADNLAGERVLCLATLRPEEAGAGRQLADALAARRAATVVPLGRLEEAATVELARACLGAAALPAAVETWLGASADGLPFLVEELLAGLVGAALLVEEDGRWSTTGPLGAQVPRPSPTRSAGGWRRWPGRPGSCWVPRPCSAAASPGRCCPPPPGWTRPQWWPGSARPLAPSCSPPRATASGSARPDPGRGPGRPAPPGAGGHRRPGPGRRRAGPSRPARGLVRAGRRPGRGGRERGPGGRAAA